MTETDAWVLRAGAEVGHAERPSGALLRERLTLPDLGPGEALVEPLVGSWEANLDHALMRSPIDVCSTREEDVVLLGNLGVVRVLEVRPGGDGPLPAVGDTCLVLPFGRVDRHGYAELVHGYDCPGTRGLLARRTTMPGRILLPLPQGTQYSLEQWATYGRYFTAWDNWSKARGCWRTQVPEAEPAEHLVLGWGGGVSVALLTLAAREGFRVAMTAGSDERIRFLQDLGIMPLDRRRFPGLSIPRRGHTGDALAQHEASLASFIEEVMELSDGQGVAIFVDNIGEPLQRATQSVLAREGVVTTCGWKAGMRMSYLRGAECIARHLHVNTHVWRLQDSATIRDFQEGSGWVAPPGSTVVYGFEDIPRLADEYNVGQIGSYFPLYTVREG